jgi:hypothetical protein
VVCLPHRILKEAGSAKTAFLCVLLTALCCVAHKNTLGTGCIVSKVQDDPDLHFYEWPKQRIFEFDPPSEGHFAVLFNVPLTLAGSPRSNTRYARSIQCVPVIKVRWR